MSCTLATLAACFSLSGIYVDSGLEYQDVGEWRWRYREDKAIQHGGVIESGGQWTIINSPQNPYARLALGYQFELQSGRSKVVLTFEAHHISSIESHTDKGVNGVSFGARYFPFARQ